MSILIKNQAIFKIIICVGVAILTISCKEVDPYADTEEYTYMPLTPELIDELGGVDSLHRYQFYLSDSFELHRVDNEKSYAGQGIVNNIDNNYSVVFDKLTPGIFHGTDLIKGVESTWRSEPDIRTISVLFEHSLYAFLTFACSDDSKSSNYKFYHVKGQLKDDTYIPLYSSDFRGGDYVKETDPQYYSLMGDSNSYYTYKNHFWNKKMIYSKKEVKDKSKNKYIYPKYSSETYLIIRIKNISKSTTERAKGIVLPENL